MQMQRKRPMTKKQEPYYEIKEGLKGLSKLIKGPGLDEQIEKEKKIKELADAMKAAETSKMYIKNYKDNKKKERRAKLKKFFGVKN